MRAAAGQLRDRVHVGDRVRGAQRPRPHQLALVDVDGDHARARGGRDHHGGEPDAAAAVHGHPLARAHARVHVQRRPRRHEPAAERGRLDVAQSLRHAHEVQVRARQRDVLRERAPGREPGLEVALADLRLAEPARLARAAAAAERHGHAVADRPAAHLGPDLGDDAAQLVARHVRQRDRRVVAHPAVPVAAAHAGGPHRDDDAVGRRHRVGHGLDRERLLERVHHGGAHAPYCRCRGPVEPAARRAAPRSGITCGTGSWIAGRRSTRSRRSRPPTRRGGRQAIGPCPDGPTDPQAAIDELFDAILPRGQRADHPRFFARDRQPEQPGERARRPDRHRAQRVRGELDGRCRGVRARARGASTGCATGWGCRRAPRACSSAAARSARSPRSPPRRRRATPDRGARPATSPSTRTPPSSARGACSASTRRTCASLSADAEHRLSADAVAAASRIDRERGLDSVLRRSPRPARPAPAPSTRSPSSRTCASARACGCTSTAPTARPRGWSRPDLVSGIERADSLVLDPHKWLFQPYEIGCVLVREPGLLERAFALDGAYLRDTGGGSVEFRNRSPQLTPRLARAEAVAEADRLRPRRLQGRDRPRDRARRARRGDAARTPRVGDRHARQPRDRLLPARGRRRRRNGRDGARGRRRRLCRTQHDRARRPHRRAAVHDQSAHHRRGHRAHDRAPRAPRAAETSQHPRIAAALSDLRPSPRDHGRGSKGDGHDVNGRRACAALGAALGTVALYAAPAASADDTVPSTTTARTARRPATRPSRMRSTRPRPGTPSPSAPAVTSRATAPPTRTRLTVDKSLTLKGAGADLVTISPRRYDGNDGVIAEDPQSIRYPRGNIITAVGTPAMPVTVDISGVTVDGNGVAAKAGVVFLDAQGSLRRSRVTDVVTSESPGALRPARRLPLLVPGVRRRAGHHGADRPDRRRTPHADDRQHAHRRVQPDRRADRRGDQLRFPVTPSGLDLHGVITASQIVGRTLCWDAHVDGDCGGPNPPGNPDPKPIADGPLFGQDGIRLAAGARGTISGSIVTQNLVQGTGAPVRNSTTNNANLRQAAGIRLVGANASDSSVTRTNIVDNAYGVLNAAADGSARRGEPVHGREQLVGPVLPRGQQPLQRRAAGEHAAGQHGPRRLADVQSALPGERGQRRRRRPTARRRSTSCRSAAGRRATRTRVSSPSCRHRSRSATPHRRSPCGPRARSTAAARRSS